VTVDFALSVITFAAVALRWLPHLVAPDGIGVDHWFWKAYIETYRRTKQFPPHLPQFLLDREQWYPPLFPLLMAYLPPALFERYAYVVALGIDLLRMALLMGIGRLVLGPGWAVAAAALFYAATPILISYNTQLNPRGLAALFLDIAIVLIYLWTLDRGSIWLLGGAILLSGAVPLTHKMTTQLMWFLCLATAAVTQSWWPLAVIPVSIGAATIMSGGFYWKVLRAHADIVAFWYRNWRWIGAHPVRESPLYAGPDTHSSRAYFAGGWKGLLRRAQFLLGFNPGMWIVVAALLAHVAFGSPLVPDRWIALWLGLIVLFMILTTFVPALRCFGNGYLYAYNGAFPAALGAGLILRDYGANFLALAGYGAAVLAALASVAVYLFKLYKTPTVRVEPELKEALDFLAGQPDGTIMCLPQHWHDIAAYHTGKPVLFGGHGYGFRQLEPVFPRLMRPIAELVDEHNVRYLITSKGYLPEQFVSALPARTVVEFGGYQVYRLQGNVPPEGDL